MALALTRPPVAPSTLRPETFAGEMDARLAWQDTNVDEMLVILPVVEGAAAAGTSAAASAAAAAASAASALAAPGTNATSSTPLTVGAGVHAIVIQANKEIVPGAVLMCARTADPDNVWMLGQARSYVKATGALTLVVAAGDTKGAGTFNDWTLSISSLRSTVFTAVDASQVGPSIRPLFQVDFANAKRLPIGAVYTMLSPQTYIDAVGGTQATLAGVPAIDHDPVTGRCMGLLMWDARTNSTRNNQMAGAVAGTPGTLPNFWGVGGNGGLSRQIVGIGSEGGIEYIDLRFFGVTANVQNAEHYVVFEAANTVAAAVGQTWTSSVYTRHVGGTLNGVLALEHFIIGINNSGVDVDALSTTFAPSANALRLNRNVFSKLLVNAGAVFIQHRLDINLSGNTAVDFTVRIGTPQLEQGATASPVMKSATGAVTRAAPTLSIPLSAMEFDPSEGTIFVEGDFAQIAGSNATLVRLDDGTDNNRIMIRLSNGTVRCQVIAGGAEVADMVLGAPTAGVPTRVACAFKLNDFAASRDGGGIVSDISAAVPTGLTTLRIGGDVSGANTANGRVARVAIYGRRIVNNEIIALASL